MPRKSVNRLGAARRRRARTGARGQPKPGATPTIRRFLIPVSVVAAVAAVAAGWAMLGGGSPTPGADAGDPALVSLGAEVYGAHCAVCHGVSLEGQAGWRRRNADGTLPAPPHDATGHTWHHPDDYLFEYTRRGGAALVPAEFRSNMPGFADALSDAEIWAALAFIKSRWPDAVRTGQDRLNRVGG